MGIKNIFGLGKKETVQEKFRVPKEINNLRIKIEAEMRENYPNLMRYEEIKRDASGVYSILSTLIDKNAFAPEAMRIKDDIDKKMESLKKIIDKNKQESKAESGSDYVESNIDYLERKSMRDKAKTLFIYIIEEIESFEKYCAMGKLEGGKTIEAETADFFKHVMELNNSYFMKHGKDKEIQGIKLEVAQRFSDLRLLFNKNKAIFQQKGLAANFESGLKLILGD